MTKRVKIKTWEEMEKEFLTYVGGRLKVEDTFFTKEMEKELPRDRIIKLYYGKNLNEWVWDSGMNDYIIKDDMVDYVVNDKDIPKKYEDAKALKKKIVNLHDMLDKTRTKVKDQTNEINLLLKQKQELKDEILRLKNRVEFEKIWVDYQKGIIKSNKDIYENQLEAQDKELERRLHIIRYLESHCLKVFDD